MAQWFSLTRPEESIRNTSTFFSMPFLRRASLCAVAMIAFGMPNRCLHPPEECPQPTRGVVGAGCRQPSYGCRTVSGRAGSAAQHPAHLSRVVITVLTPAGQQAGLFTDSVVMTDNLATVAEVAIDQWMRYTR